MKQQRKMQPIEDRFWQKVDIKKKHECWNWKSSVRGNGYGAFFTHLIPEGRKCHGAHRFSWTLVKGEIPEGLWVLHKCDNRLCVNPDHLFLGDRVANMKDAAQKKRVCTIGKSRLTHCIHGHEFTNENIYRTKEGHRKCRTCIKKRDAGRKR